MPNPDRRTKMISVRLSQVEYDVLKSRYRNYGARNVSDLARLALQRIVAGSPPQRLAARLQDLDGRVQALESQLGIAGGLFENSRDVIERDPS